MQKGYSQLASYPRPFWLCLFVEGTRFTQAKLRAAQEFAASKGLPVPHYTLVPKTKVRQQTFQESGGLPGLPTLVEIFCL